MATSHEFAVSRRTSSFPPPMALDFGSETPLYRQISMWFQQAILSGRLQPGQRVPSTRALAKELGVSRIPVVSAYELLIAEGYLQTFVGAGTCVSQSIPDSLFKPQREALADTLVVEPRARAPRTVSRRALELEGPARNWLRRAGGCTNLQQFPVATWSRLLSRHARKASKEAMGYGDPMGYGPFREAIAEYLGAFRAVKCDPSQVMVTTGSQQALQIASLALLDPGDRVWVEEPGYPGTQQALRAAGASLVPVPVDQEGMNVGHGIELARRARAAFVTPAHQFPLGVSMSAARRIELLNWASVNGAWIIEDDYDSEYRFGGNPFASLQGLDGDGRVIYLGTLTKVVFPTVRLGYIVLPKDLTGSFLDVRNATDTVATTMLYQMAMTDFIREGHFSRHIRRMRALYMEKRSALAAAIGAQARGALEVVGDEAGMLLCALLPPGLSDVEIVSRIPKGGATAYPLSECYASPPQRGGLMFGYANLDVREIPAAVNAIVAVIRANMPRQ
jgi:GntR family transcriptional regulator/MocR family aminotransferase